MTEMKYKDGFAQLPQSALDYDEWNASLKKLNREFKRAKNSGNEKQLKILGHKITELELKMDKHASKVNIEITSK